MHYTIYTDTCTHRHTHKHSQHSHINIQFRHLPICTHITDSEKDMNFMSVRRRQRNREGNRQTDRQTDTQTYNRQRQRETDREKRQRPTERTVGSNTHQSSLAYLADAVTEGLHAACAVEMNDFMTVLVCSLTKGNIIWSTSQVILCVHVCTSPDQTAVCTNNGVVLL